MDSDFLYAKKLQEKFDREGITAGSTKIAKSSKNENNSIVDPNWEICDPNPDIYNLFQLFNSKFFWNQLGCVEVKWSPRMYSCAGICTYKGRQGCVVSLSLPLLKLRPRKDLVETLLHEMIHAYLFVTDKNREREEHGPKFHSHMFRINKAAGTNITVYHTFHDEVKHYKTHWWRCNGQCRFKPPYYGLVKRSMNRAPGPNDFWFAEHNLTCGGEFIKVKEPDGFKSRKSKKQKANEENQGKQNNLDKYLSPPHPNKPKTANTSTMNSSKISGDNKPTVQPLGRSNNIHGFVGLASPAGKPTNSSSSKNGNRTGTGFGMGVLSNRGGTLLEKPRTIASTSASKPKTTEVQSTLSFPHSNKGQVCGKPNNTSGKNVSKTGSSGLGVLSNRSGTSLEKPRTTASPSPSKQKTTQLQLTFTPYSGQGHVLDPNCKNTEINRANSRLLSLYPIQRNSSLSKKDEENPKKKPKIEICEGAVSQLDNENVDDYSGNLVNCPVCNKKLTQEQVNEHLDECMNLSSIMESISESVIIEDDTEEVDEGTPNQAVHCPNCDELCTLESINQHLDDCLQSA